MTSFFIKKKNTKTLWMALKCIIMKWRFVDVLSSKVISIAENVLILNKIQVEENVSAFNTIFGIDINGVKYFKS